MKKLITLFFLIATAASAATLALKWDHPEGASEYRLYEQDRAVPTKWTLVKTVAAPTPGLAPREVQLTGIAPGVHTYRVTAFEVLESPPSNEVTNTLTPSAPVNLTVTVVVSVTVTVPPTP